MAIRDNRRTLWLFLIRIEEINHGQTEKVEKCMPLA